MLPNSRAEAGSCHASSAPTRRRIRVVPNGVEARFADADPGRFRADSATATFVLYVGRVEPRKNVLGLMRGPRPAGLPLVVLGDAAPGHEAYRAACRRRGGGFDAMAAGGSSMTTRCWPRPTRRRGSWRCRAGSRRPGLAALEGALAGRAVVVTPLGCTREYFGDRVVYARPDRPAAIGGRCAGLGRGAGPGVGGHVGGALPVVGRGPSDGGGL